MRAGLGCLAEGIKQGNQQRVRALRINARAHPNAPPWRRTVMRVGSRQAWSACCPPTSRRGPDFSTMSKKRSRSVVVCCRCAQKVETALHVSERKKYLAIFEVVIRHLLIRCCYATSQCRAAALLFLGFMLSRRSKRRDVGPRRHCLHCSRGTSCPRT